MRRSIRESGRERGGAMTVASRPWAIRRSRIDAQRARSISVYVALVLGLFVLIVAFAVPLFPTYDPTTQDLSRAQLPPFSGANLFGTDVLGRDLLSRLSLAARISLTIAVVVVSLSVLVGICVGLVAGYRGGITDQLLMSLADLQLAVPVLLLLIAIIAVVGAGPVTLVFVLTLAFWVRYARVVRVATLSLRDREFSRAATTFGASHRWIVRRHVIPHLFSSVLVMAAFDVGLVLTAEASLSYLGLGVQAPTPSFGGMILDGQPYLQRNPWLVLAPGATVFALLASIQILSHQMTTTSGRAGLAGLSGKR
jgi:peptide/nickel transport system permease protein